MPLMPRLPLRQKTSKPPLLEAASLKKILDDSSGINRNLGLAFISVVIYVLITVGSTTDLMLVLADDTPIQLPIVNIGIPLLSFYFITPLLLLGLHLNLLINLKQHSNTYFRWYDAFGKNISPDDKDAMLHPFLLNYLLTPTNKNFVYHTTRFLVEGVVFFMPLVVFNVIQLRFSDYQSATYTTVHFLFFLADVYLVFYYRAAIFNAVEAKNIWQLNRENGFLTFSRWLPLKKTIQKLFKKESRPNNLPLFQHLIILFLFWGTIINGVVNTIIVILVSSDKYYETVGELYTKYSWTPIYTPRISVIGQDITKKTIHENLNIDYQKYSKSIWELDVGIILNNRCLRYAIFSFSKLHNAHFSFAKLDSAEFIRAHLQEADFSNTSLNNTNFMSAEMQSAYLGELNLEKTNFKHCLLNNVNLSGSLLKGIDFSYAQLQGASLHGAKMQGATLFGAQLEGSDLQFASLEGSSFERANLQGADLRGAKLQGVNLNGANLLGADLSFAQLQGANLQAVNLQGADLSSISLQGVFLDYIEASGILINPRYKALAPVFYKKIRYSPYKLNDLLADSIFILDGKLKSHQGYYHTDRRIEFIKKIKLGNLSTIFKDKLPPSDFKNFLDYRKKMVCVEYIKLINLLIYPYSYHSDDLTANIIQHNKEVIEVAQKNCPEKLKEIENIDLKPYTEY